MNLLFTDVLLLPMTDRLPRTLTGSLGISGNRIALVSEDPAAKEAFLAAHPDARVIDGRGKLLMPGLIDTHCHTAMTLQRSYADDIALMAWLNDYIWPFEAQQTPDDIALGMTLGIVELLLGGVTSVVDMYFHEDRCVEVVRALGIRAMLGCSHFEKDIDAALRSAERALDEAAGCDRIRIAMAPHSGYTCSPATLVRSKEFATKHGLHFMSHIAETQDETRILGRNPRLKQLLV